MIGQVRLIPNLVVLYLCAVAGSECASKCSEAVRFIGGDRRIIIELPGVEDPDLAIATIKETGLLEFADAGDFYLPPGVTVQTTYPVLWSEGAETHFVEPESPSDLTPTPPASSITETLPITSLLDIEPPSQVLTPSEPETGVITPGTEAGTEPPTPEEEGPLPTITDRVFATVLTGAHLENAGASRDQIGNISVGLQFTEEGAEIFNDYTATHIGEFLGIVLDKQLISLPRISQAITGDMASITGSFTVEEANNLAIQLRFGALPIPLKVVESKTVGPTLGQDSLQKSTIAGLVGLGVVMAFMILYYRLPGLLADLALLCYATITFALFKTIPVTLTLPGIAGFVLSIGVAVDANVLIFERLKEELRSGRNLRTAIDLGFSRAWPSIRDSNISTLITCMILYWFGNTFGASIVKGFSITLALGVLVSLFTAITVTRTFMHIVLDNISFADHPRWFGI